MISLDVGCGTDKRGDVGIDIQASKSVDILASASFLPIRDSCFDKVRSSHVLEHLRRPRIALSEVHRVLKPHGRLNMWLPKRTDVLHQFVYEIGLRKFLEISRKKHKPAMIHRWQFSKDWLKEALSNCGFESRIKEIKRPLFFGHLGKLLRMEVKKEYFVEALKNDNS